MLIDLHSHSYYSDGVLSPAALVRLAHETNCDAFALTDHDTIDGLEEAMVESENIGLNLIPGVEISAMWSNMTVHIVGLGIDPESETLKKGLQKHKELRSHRATRMARGLSGAGIKGALEKTLAIASGGMITRTHFAQMLIQEGVCKDMKTVFRRYLTGKKPGGVGVEWDSYGEVIGWIHAAGGVAVIAHPLRYRMTNTKARRMMESLKEAGCEGVEVVTATSTEDEITLTSKWANELDLLSSSGSDYHGWPNQRIRIGDLKELPDPKKHILNKILNG
jgi:hypothetical protein